MNMPNSYEINKKANEMHFTSKQQKAAFILGATWMRVEVRRLNQDEKLLLFKNEK